MAKDEVIVKRSPSILDEIGRLHRMIEERAYHVFRDGTGNGPIADWMSAERDLIWKPAIDLRQKDGQFEVMAAVPGMEPKDLDVEITPDALLIKGEASHERKTDKGEIHMSEFSHGKLFRSIDFPAKVDPDTVKTEYKNGMLRVKATLAKNAEARKVDIKAA